MAAPVNPYHPWTDVSHRVGWRLQQSVYGQWRIQDSGDATRWSGDASQADAQWRRLIEEHALRWQPGPFLIALHGLGHQRRTMVPIAQRMKPIFGKNIIRFEYASCHRSIGQHATALDHVLAQLPEGSHCSFVAHSLGNIVKRRWFGMRRDGQAEARVEPERMVMLAPPNQGSELARRIGGQWLFRRYTGATGQELGRSWQDLEPDLAAPDIPFGVIAAQVPRWMVNPLLWGEGDWIVRVGETRLDGAAETITVPAVHAIMTRFPSVLSAVERFLRTEKFV